MVLGVVACVIQPWVFFHVFVHIFCLDVQDQAVCVCVYQLAFVVVSGFQVVVEEVIHQNLAVLEYRHACVHWLVQHELCFAYVDARHVVFKDCESVKGWTRQQLAYLVSLSISHYLHVNTVSQVLHRLAKHRVVH